MKYKKLVATLAIVGFLSACGSDSSSNSDLNSSSRPNFELTLKVNGKKYSTSEPFELTDDDFTVSWTASNRVDFYISNTPDITNDSKKIYGYNGGSFELSCSIDAGYIEINCDQQSNLIGGTAIISSLVSQIPTTLYFIAKETTFVVLDEDVKSVSLPIRLN